MEGAKTFKIWQTYSPSMVTHKCLFSTLEQAIVNRYLTQAELFYQFLLAILLLEPYSPSCVHFIVINGIYFSDIIKCWLVSCKFHTCTLQDSCSNKALAQSTDHHCIWHPKPIALIGLLYVHTAVVLAVLYMCERKSTKFLKPYCLKGK